MTEELKLKLCPACDESKLEQLRNDDGSYSVACPHCLMRGPGCGGPTWAVESWNALPRRPQPANRLYEEKAL